MKKKLLLMFCLGSLFGFIVAFANNSNVFINSKNVLNNITYSINEFEKFESENEFYTSNIMFSNKKFNNVNTYIPKYINISKESAIKTANIFLTNYKFNENKESYNFISEKATLKVFKSFNGFEYKVSTKKNENNSFNKDIVASKKNANEIADKFFEDNNLSNEHEESIVTIEDGCYKIVYVKNLNGISNYGFNNKVILNKNKELIELTYYNISYEKIGSYNLISQKEAYEKLVQIQSKEELIQNSNEKTLDSNVEKKEKKSKKIRNIEESDLVYVFVDSVLQPYYIFSGKNSDGNHFDELVDANVNIKN